MTMIGPALHLLPASGCGSQYRRILVRLIHQATDGYFIVFGGNSAGRDQARAYEKFDGTTNG